MKQKETPVKNKVAADQTMKIKDIENLIIFVQGSGVAEVSLEQKDFKITIKTTHGGMVTHSLPPVTHQQHTVHAPVMPPAPMAEIPKVAEESKNVIIKSPMIGTFYRSSTADKPVYVNIGDEIKQGQVLCIIEAMKLFNEIESEISGTIVKVLVDNSTPVEYDQPLFLVEPK